MTEPRFDETSYLALHKDVQLGIERGYFRSGLEHYEKYGRDEGRKIVRFDADSHSIRDYTRLVRKLIATHPGNLERIYRISFQDGFKLIRKNRVSGGKVSGCDNRLQ